MSRRHQTYKAIQSLLADGRWHEASELERVTRYAHLWLAELRQDPTTEVVNDRERVLLRTRTPSSVS